jgi:hypothetical protein
VTDARFPERWLNDARLQRVTPGAYRLFGNGLMWAVANRTDGHVPGWALGMIPHGFEADANELAAAGLWAGHETDGWIIADFEATQTSRTELEVLDNARRRDREKKRRQRANVPGDNPGGLSPGTNGGTALGQARPGPSGPGQPVLQGQNQDQDHSVANSQNPRVHHGPVNGSSPTPADQTTHVGEQPQTVTRASRRPATLQRQQERRNRIYAYVLANPECTGNSIQAAIGGNRQAQLDALGDLMAEGKVRRVAHPSDGRFIRYTANGTAS